MQKHQQSHKPRVVKSVENEQNKQTHTNINSKPAPELEYRRKSRMEMLIPWQNGRIEIQTDLFENSLRDLLGKV